jgi:hypothetical protein
MAAKVRLAAGAPEQRFDFTFTELTRDPTPSAAARDGRTTTTKPAAPSPAPQPAVAPADVAPPSATAETPAPDPALVNLPIPETVPEMLDQLRTRSTQIAGLIERGDFGAVWVPAFQAKDLAIALESRLDGLDNARREAAAPALQRVVRYSWLLDAHGDTGNRQNVSTAYEAFSKAVGEVLTLFGEKPR